MVALLYWMSLLTLLYTWFLYGVALWVAVRLRGRPKDSPQAADQPPMITVIIAAHNEERSILSRLENLRSLRYDPRRLEVLVASDGSTDATQRIVSELESSREGIRLLDFPHHRGRAAVHNDAVPHARGDILIFTDAETRFHEDFLEHIVPYFQIASVGAVSGRISYINEESPSNTFSAGLYWELEERLRAWESTLGILAFGTGAAFCMRKGLFEPLGAYDDVDYTETLVIVARGHQVKYEPRAVAYDRISPFLNTTYRVRERKTSMAFRSIIARVLALRLWRRPGIFLSILSHKVLRHVTPFLLISLVVSNAFLFSSGTWYRLTFVLQLAFYLLAFMGWIGYWKRWRIKPLALPFTFVLLNFSRLVGVMDSLLRKPPSTYR